MKQPSRLLILAAACFTALTVNAHGDNQPFSPAEGDLGVGDVLYADFTIFDERLEALGIAASLEKIEYVTAPGSARRGRTLLASDRQTRQLGSHWVPGDPRRGGYLDLSWAVDLAEGGTGSGLTPAETEEAIDRAALSWEGPRCSSLELVKNPLAPTLDVGIVEHMLGFDGKPYWVADITHAGWQPKEFFDLMTPGGGDFILAGTYTFVWVDRYRKPTDIDNDGKADVAFKEIYYNDAFAWVTGNPSPHGGGHDVETIALHEMGHGLSLGHFGDIFLDAKDRIHFAPEAVMNAISPGIVRDLRGSDIGAHCDVWSGWPDG